MKMNEKKIKSKTGLQFNEMTAPNLQPIANANAGCKQPQLFWCLYGLEKKQSNINTNTFTYKKKNFVLGGFSTCYFIHYRSIFCFHSLGATIYDFYKKYEK